MRDALMGKEAQDFDFATPLKPEEMELRLKARKKHVYTVGKRFGTLGFKEAGRLYELTTFRSEHYQPHSRHPEVSFTDSLSLDLRRRDFTINAMAYDGKKLIDLHNGQDDLIHKRIASVGDPFERMQEDPLRILRAARFAAQLGFVIEDELFAAMHSLRFSLFELSQERIVAEFTKLICAKAPLQGLSYLNDSAILGLLFYELSYLQHNRSMCFELARSLGKLEPTAAERWAVIFAYMSKAFSYECEKQRKQLAQHQLKKYSSYLRFSKALHQDIEKILEQPWKFWIFN